MHTGGPVTPGSAHTPPRGRNEAVSDTIQRRLSSLRLEQRRHQLNLGLQAKTAVPSPPVHPALAWIEREEVKHRAESVRDRVAGPLPQSWTTPYVAAPPPSATREHTDRGRSERRRLRPHVIGGETAAGHPTSSLSDVCARQVARSLGQGDDVTLASICCLPMHLKQCLLRVAAIEAPVCERSVWALLMEDDLDAHDSPTSPTERTSSDEWERADRPPDEPLTVLDLRFSDVTTASLLDVLFTAREPTPLPRFAALETLDISFCARITLSPTVVRHLTHLPHLAHLALVGHEHVLTSTPGSLTRLATVTPHLRSLELGSSVSLSHLEHFAWSVLWIRLERLIIRGFRLPPPLSTAPPSSSHDQPRAGTLRPSRPASATEDAHEAERAVCAVRTAIKRAGRTRWLDIILT